MADPITPPPELVQQWLKERTLLKSQPLAHTYLATRAAQWGADQELEACCDWLSDFAPDPDWPVDLLVARRPKSPSLNSIALEMLLVIEKMNVVIPEITDTIRRALEEIDG
jgi:hypothetical protein